MKPCRKCGLKNYKIAPSQIKKCNWICQDCKRAVWKEGYHKKGWRGGKVRKGYQSEYTKKYVMRPGIKFKKAATMKKYRKNLNLRPKHIARWKLNRAVSSGQIKKMPCEKCGAEKVQAHHYDYNKPLDVQWLCLKCHRKEHTKAEGRGV